MAMRPVVNPNTTSNGHAVFTGDLHEGSSMAAAFVMGYAQTGHSATRRAYPDAAGTLERARHSCTQTSG